MPPPTEPLEVDTPTNVQNQEADSKSVDLGRAESTMYQQVQRFSFNNTQNAQPTDVQPNEHPPADFQSINHPFEPANMYNKQEDRKEYPQSNLGYNNQNTGYNQAPMIPPMNRQQNITNSQNPPNDLQAQLQSLTYQNAQLQRMLQQADSTHNTQEKRINELQNQLENERVENHNKVGFLLREKNKMQNQKCSNNRRP